MVFDMTYIVLLNYKKWIDTVDCISSVKKHVKSRYTVVVVDNNSGNDSIDQIRRCHPEVELLSMSENLGFAGGCNAGIRHAIKNDANYIWLLNNDVELENDALKPMLESANNAPKIGAVGSVVYYYDSRDKIQVYGGGVFNQFSGRITRDILPTKRALGYLSGVSILLPRKIVDDVGLLDESFFMYWEDVEYSLRIRNKGYALSVAPGSCIFHKVSSSLKKDGQTKRSSFFDYYMAESFVKFYKKRFPLLLPICLVNILLKILKRVLTKDFRGSWAVLQGTAKSLGLSLLL